MTALALGAVFSFVIAPSKVKAEIIESVSEGIDEANATQYSGAKGVSGCNQLENVTMFIDYTAHPVRSGKQAFRHWVDHCGERSQLRMRKTKIGYPREMG